MGRRDRRIQAVVDRLLLEQGSYAPVELFLSMGRLPYERYEAWRLGEVDFLEDALLGNVERSLEELKTAADWAARLGLAAGYEEYTGWGSHAGEALCFSRSPDRERLFRSHYQRTADDEPQMDLFLDSGATPLLRALSDALIAHNRSLADARLVDLLNRYPEHRLRPAAERLCDSLSHLESSAECSDTVTEIAFVEGRLTPMAVDLLGRRSARDFLVPFWRRLARSLEGWPFDPAQNRVHASYAYAKCLDWQAVIDSVLSTAGDALDQPVLIERLAEAFWHSDQRIPAISYWCQLCWRFPENAASLFSAPHFPDAVLQGAWESFQDLDQQPGPAWFPAWLMLQQRGLARALPSDLSPDMPGPGRAFRILQRLSVDSSVSYEEEIGLRRALQAEAPEFFSLFLDWKGGHGPGPGVAAECRR